MAGVVEPADPRVIGSGEARVARRWANGIPGIVRLADGRPLRVVHPGVPGPGPGPDFRGAALEINGDPIHGDVEVHVRESAWGDHRHAGDPAYGAVALHVVGENDRGVVATRTASGRAIPLLVLRERGRSLAGFAPPCSGAAPEVVGAALEALGRRRFEEKVARLSLLVEARGAAQGLYHALLETLGGPSNRAAFADVARRLPLAALLDRADGVAAAEPRQRVLAAELRWAAASLVIRFAGQRPMAWPARRLWVVAGLVGSLWPAGAAAGWPACLSPPQVELPRLRGLGRAARSEVLVNAVYPVLALATGDHEAVLADWLAVGSPGTYGHLRMLEGWLTREGAAPFRRAGTLQGGLALHRTACTRGLCGRCPITARPTTPGGAC